MCFSFPCPPLLRFLSHFLSAFFVRYIVLVATNQRNVIGKVTLNTLHFNHSIQSLVANDKNTCVVSYISYSFREKKLLVFV